MMYHSPWASYSIKSEIYALILSMLFTGMGTAYAGRIVRGASMLVCQSLLCVFEYYAAMAVLSGDWGVFEWVLIAAVVVFAVMIVALWVYGVRDAYLSTKQYNGFLFNMGQPPW